MGAGHAGFVFELSSIKANFENINSWHLLWQKLLW